MSDAQNDTLAETKVVRIAKRYDAVPAGDIAALLGFDVSYVHSVLKANGLSRPRGRQTYATEARRRGQLDELALALPPAEVD